MKPASIEHSRFAYGADFAIYLVAILVSLGVLVSLAPRARWWMLAVAVLAGLTLWTLVEYAMHRLVFHGVEPFQRMHGEHHRRPRALISTPTSWSLAMIASLFWLPAVLVAGRWVGSAMTLGLVTGYFLYGVMHHGLHHWRARGAWMQRCKHLHAIHHRSPTVNYGVSMRWWDRLFRTLQAP